MRRVPHRLRLEIDDNEKNQLSAHIPSAQIIAGRQQYMGERLHENRREKHGNDVDIRANDEVPRLLKKLQPLTSPPPLRNNAPPPMPP